MSGFILMPVICLFLAASFGDAVRCYHCYEYSNRTLNVRSVDAANFGDKLIRCDKNKNNWNSWDCPASFPICVIVSGKVMDHTELVRTCAERDFCSKYIPPSGVKINYCQECNTTLCNDYQRLPDPPFGPGPLFTFNININLNLKRLPVDNRRTSD